MNTMLLAVSGMSPAIITETLYGINKRGDAWPKSIKIITTSIGADKIWQGLVEHQQLERLCAELDKPLIHSESAAARPAQEPGQRPAANTDLQ